MRSDGHRETVGDPKYLTAQEIPTASKAEDDRAKLVAMIPLTQVALVACGSSTRPCAGAHDARVRLRRPCTLSPPRWLGNQPRVHDVCVILGNQPRVHDVCVIRTVGWVCGEYWSHDVPNDDCAVCGISEPPRLLLCYQTAIKHRRDRILVTVVLREQAANVCARVCWIRRLTDRPAWTRPRPS